MGYVHITLTDVTRLHSTSCLSCRDPSSPVIAIFGTAHSAPVSLTVAGQEHRHQFTGQQVFIVSSTDGHAVNNAGEHNELIGQLQQPVDGLTYIAPNVAKIDFITDASASTQVTYLSTSPAMMSPTAQGYHRVVRQRVNSTNRAQLTTPLWNQFIPLDAIHSFTASSASSLPVTNIGFLSTARSSSHTSTSDYYPRNPRALFPDDSCSSSIVGVFSHHTTNSLYVSVPVSQRHRLPLHSLDSANVSIRRCNPVCEASIAAYPRMALVIDDPDVDQRHM